MNFKTCLFGLLSVLILPNIANASHYVRDYTRSDGTEVKGHMSMDPGESASTGLSYHHDQIVPRHDYNDNNYEQNYSLSNTQHAESFDNEDTETDNLNDDDSY